MADFVLNRTDDIGFDLWLIAGQSNAEGFATDYNATAIDVPDSRVWQYGSGGTLDSVISQAQIPLASRSTGQTGYGMGPALEFARWHVHRLPTNRKILLVNGAVGGAPFVPPSAFPFVNENSWDQSNTTVTTNLATRLVAYAKAALAAAGPNARYAGVIWVQGETDAANGVSGATYQGYLDGLIAWVRTQLSAPTLPWVIGQMVPEYITGTRIPINAVHVDTPRRTTSTSFAYGTVGANRGDGNHYNAAGARVNGRTLARAYKRALLNVTGTAPIAPTAPTLTQSGTNTVMTWNQPECRTTDFNVQYSTNGGTSWTALTRAQSIDVTATLTGLALGSTVLTQVRTINEQGTSAWSPSGTLTLAQIPNAVGTVTAGTATSSQQPLTWAAPTNDGTHTASTSYVVQYKLHTDSSWTTSGTVAGVSATVTGLNDTTSYDYRVVAQNAAGQAAASPTTTASTAAPVAIVDTFTRADSTTALGTPSDGGGGWSLLEAGSAVFGISSNRAYTPTTSDRAKAIRTVGNPNCKVSVSVPTLTWTGSASATENAGIVLLSDTANYLTATWTANGALTVYKRVASTYTVVGSALAAGTVTVGSTVELKKFGTTVTVSVNGSVVLTQTVSDSALTSLPYAGIRTGGTLVKYWDDFSAVGVSS